jgi:hypothetical protein
MWWLLALKVIGVAIAASAKNLVNLYFNLLEAREKRKGKDKNPESR